MVGDLGLGAFCRTDDYLVLLGTVGPRGRVGRRHQRTTFDYPRFGERSDSTHATICYKFFVLSMVAFLIQVLSGVAMETDEWEKDQMKETPRLSPMVCLCRISHIYHPCTHILTNNTNRNGDKEIEIWHRRKHRRTRQALYGSIFVLFCFYLLFCIFISWNLWNFLLCGLMLLFCLVRLLFIVSLFIN